jgi:hypothetical protein
MNLQLEHSSAQSRAYSRKAISPIMFALVDDNWGRLFQIREDHVHEVLRLECVENSDGFHPHEPNGRLVPTRGGLNKSLDQQALFSAALITELVQYRRETNFLSWWLAGAERAREALLEECTPGLRSVLYAQLELSVFADVHEIWPVVQQKRSEVIVSRARPF